MPKFFVQVKHCFRRVSNVFRGRLCFAGGCVSRAAARARASGVPRVLLRGAVALARVRRLTELGLSLDEVGGALADDAGRDPAEILRELGADLARRARQHWHAYADGCRSGNELQPP